MPQCDARGGRQMWHVEHQRRSLSSARKRTVSALQHLALSELAAAETCSGGGSDESPYGSAAASSTLTSSRDTSDAPAKRSCHR